MHQYREYRYSRRFPGRAMPNPATSTFTPSFQLMEGIELGFTHVAGWSSPVAREAHNLEVTGSNPVPAIRPVLVTGAISEEPAVTRVVSAGSVVACGSVLPNADACGVAFRVAMDAQFTSHSIGLPCPSSAPTSGLESSVPTTSSKWWSRDIR